MINLLKSLIFLFIKKNNYLTSKPMGSREKYIALHDDCKNNTYSDIYEIEEKNGYRIDNEYYENLALHTQVCIKKSKLNYQHGRILYSFIRKYLNDNFNNGISKTINIFETGTARGFSSICMSKAIIDSDKIGHILTCDLIPHNHSMYWNCIDDNDGKKTREQLLNNWSTELELITFLHGETRKTLLSIGQSRIHFAFLDAQHKYKDVILEFEFVCKRQIKGDYIIFDDVTQKLFPGVFNAVKKIEDDGKYSINYISLSDERGYAIAIKN